MTKQNVELFKTILSEIDTEQDVTELICIMKSFFTDVYERSGDRFSEDCSEKLQDLADYCKRKAPRKEHSLLEDLKNEK